MQNRYKFIGGNDLNGRMFVYEDKMKKYNLSSDAIRDFAKAIRSGNLEDLKQEFEGLSKQQKEGLLNLLIDYNNLSGNFMNLSAPYGFPCDLAKRFKHENIANFLESEKKKLAAYTRGATVGLLKDIFLTEINTHISSFLKIKDGMQLAQTRKSASDIAKGVQNLAENTLSNKI